MTIRMFPLATSSGSRENLKPLPQHLCFPPLSPLLILQFGPFTVLLIGILFVVVAIAVFRIHAFLSLILASVVVGGLATTLPRELKAAIRS